MLDLRTRALLGVLFLSQASCTVVYDKDVFATGDAAVVIEPTEVSLESVEPASFLEGVGASELARAVPIVVHGKNIAPGARLQIVGAGIDLDVEAQTSFDGTMAAATIRVPVDTELPAGESVPVTITLSQAGVEQTLSFNVKGLDELGALPLDENGDMDTGALAAAYSQIAISEDVKLVGNKVARFVATDSITLSSAIHADGRSDGLRSAGGFLGGAPLQRGGGDSGGESGDTNAGGGGAGNLETGGSGQGDGSGTGGAAVEVTLLSPLAKVVGYGGGGGGGSAVGDGSGGAGGGAIELRAGGVLTLAEGALLSADGAAGGAGNCGLLTSNGGGGGGSGGALLLRSATEIIVADGVTASVAAGLGGASTTCKGGDGSPGQVRADFPTLQGTLSTTVVGPTFLPGSVPPVVTTATLTATIAGGVGETYYLSVNAAGKEPLTLSDVTEDIVLTLNPGLNQVCVLVNTDGNQGQPESLTCVSIAYLPAP